MSRQPPSFGFKAGAPNLLREMTAERPVEVCRIFAAGNESLFPPNRGLLNREKDIYGVLLLFRKPVLHPVQAIRHSGAELTDKPRVRWTDHCSTGARLDAVVGSRGIFCDSHQRRGKEVGSFLDAPRVQHALRF